MPVPYETKSLVTSPEGEAYSEEASLARTRSELARERSQPSTGATSATVFDRVLPGMLGGARSGHVWRATARWIGLGCFLLGIALLLWTFVQAARGFQSFTEPDTLSSKFNRISGDSYQSQLGAGIITIGAEGLRVFYLLLLGAFASLLAARGAQFFAASDAVLDEAITSE